MDANFSIAVDHETLVQEDGAVIGIISVQLKSHSFPDERWYDFPVIVLGWWIGAMLKLIDSESMQQDFDFMDGPYRFVVVRESRDGWRVTLIDRRENRKEVGTGLVAPMTLKSELICAATKVLNAVDSRGWEGKDIRDLRNLAVRLSAKID